MRFYNLGLEVDAEKLKKCPQLNVSINTDDQGVFNTSLENEYSLLARSLENMKDENGDRKYNDKMIYQWLDNIRQMGLMQSFINR
jgi:adenosine deaminase